MRHRAEVKWADGADDAVVDGIDTRGAHLKAMVPPTITDRFPPLDLEELIARIKAFDGEDSIGRSEPAAGWWKRTQSSATGGAGLGATDARAASLGSPARTTCAT